MDCTLALHITDHLNNCVFWKLTTTHGHGLPVNVPLTPCSLFNELGHERPHQGVFLRHFGIQIT